MGEALTCGTMGALGAFSISKYCLITESGEVLTRSLVDLVEETCPELLSKIQLLQIEVGDDLSPGKAALVLDDEEYQPMERRVLYHQPAWR
jgi:hypothetical protein